MCQQMLSGVLGSGTTSRLACDLQPGQLPHELVFRQLPCLLGTQACEKIERSRYDSSPTGLMACTQSSPVVAMEVFIEEDVILPVRVLLEFPRSAVDWASAVFVAQENGCQSSRDLFCDFEQSQIVSGTSRALHFELISIKLIQVQQTPDNEGIHRHPDRTSPVRISSKHPCIRFSRKVLH